MMIIATPPKSVPKKGATRYGLIYSYAPARTLDGASRPAVLIYYLDGVNQQCGVNDVLREWSDTELHRSTTGYSIGNIDGSGKTSCYVSIPA